MLLGLLGLTKEVMDSKDRFSSFKKWLADSALISSTRQQHAHQQQRSQQRAHRKRKSALFNTRALSNSVLTDSTLLASCILTVQRARGGLSFGEYDSCGDLAFDKNGT